VREQESVPSKLGLAIHNLPKSWSTLRLDEVAQIERGSVTPEAIKAGTTYVGLEHIDSDGGFTQITQVGAGDLASNKFSFNENHILFGKLRPYLRKTACPSFRGVCSTDIVPILVGPRIDKRFLLHFLRHPKTVEQSTLRCSGANLPRLSPKDIAATTVPLPPLPEQRRIADILDKADAIRKKRKQAIALTEQLLRSAFLEMFGDPVTNPKGWPVRPLGEVANIMGGGTPSRAQPDFFNGTIPWATAKDFRSDSMSRTQEHVSSAAISTSATKLVQPGTILVVVKSKILMRRLPVAIAEVELCFNQDVKGIIPLAPPESRFIASHLRMAQSKLLELARGANTEGLTIQHLKGHMVMRPPEHLILKFCKLDSYLRTSLNRQADTWLHGEGLFKSLVHRAFRGELSTLSGRSGNATS
jgi:type I restriction enzyme, S subunit